MAEVKVGPNVYRTGRLDARTQFHVARRIAPMLDDMREAAIASVAKGGDMFGSINGPIARGLADMKQADADYVIDACLAVATRKQSEVVWSAVSSRGQIMFDDMSMEDLTAIVVAAIGENLRNFIVGVPAPMSPEGQTKAAPSS